MRAITVRQPWATAIIRLGKDVENRTRSLGPYRGPVAIHASMAWADSWEGLWPGQHPEPTDLHAMDDARGYVLGVVDLVDVHADCTEPVEGYGHTSTCSRWAQSGHHHLVLADPLPLPRPIPANGQLGLWRPDDTLVSAITEQRGGIAADNPGRTA